MLPLPLGTVVGPTPGTNPTPAPVPAPTPANPPAANPPAPNANQLVTTAPGATGPAATGTGDQTKPQGHWTEAIGTLLPFILIFVVLYFLLFRGQKKERDAQKKMLEALKKGDRVMTIGGMIGSVVDVRGDEVVLKIDEANNVKARYIKSAIQKVLETDTKVEDNKK